MRLTVPRHPCAVCHRQIQHGYLMCLMHWHLVPKDEQRDVNRTWAASKRTHGRTGYAAAVHAEYVQARDRAIQSVRAALAGPGGLPIKVAPPIASPEPGTHRKDIAR